MQVLLAWQNQEQLARTVTGGRTAYLSKVTALTRLRLGQGGVGGVG